LAVELALVNLAAIDLNVLVALDAVLSERNVTRAAARIGRSQPATSHALNRARELFKDPLVVRVRGALELTARARLVAPRIHRLLRDLGAVLDAHKDFDPAAVECVTIGATDYVGFVLLPYLFQILQEVAPRLSVRIRTVEGPDALDPLVSGVVDVAVGTFPQTPAGLRFEQLFGEEFVCVRRRATGRSASRVSVGEFAALGHVLVVSPSAGQGPVDYALARRGRSRHIVAYVPQFLVAPSIVAATNLVLTTGRRIAERLAPSLDLELFAPPFALKPFGVRMVWHPRTEDDSVGRWLRSALREATSRLLLSERRRAEEPDRRRARPKARRSPGDPQGKRSREAAKPRSRPVRA
jgi:DNA-binding transcriptional LysR family regulator